MAAHLQSGCLLMAEPSFFPENFVGGRVHAGFLDIDDPQA